jgi:hypothetical protein
MTPPHAGTGGARFHRYAEVSAQPGAGETPASVPEDFEPDSAAARRIIDHALAEGRDGSANRRQAVLEAIDSGCRHAIA